MKFKHFVIYILLSFVCININAQKFINQGCYWPNYAPNGTTLRMTADSTSEDWWFDMKTVPQNHIAYFPGSYICAGYSGFDDAEMGNPYASEPCAAFRFTEINFLDQLFDYRDFELPDMRHNGTAGTIGLVNLTRTSNPANPNLWIYNYGKGSFFTKVIPTSDGGFLATGAMNRFKIPYIPGGPQVEIQFSGFINNAPPSNPSDIYYQSPSVVIGNPNEKNAFNLSPYCPPFPSDPVAGGFKRHACLAKVNKDGILQWLYTYGIVPHDGISGEIAYKNSTLGTDLVENANGYILSGILQNSPIFGDYANHPFLLQVDINGNLIWIKQYHDNLYKSEKFTAIKLKSATEIYVTGERTYDVAIAGGCISSNCLNGSTHAIMEHPRTMKFLSFVKKINITNGNEIWDLPLTQNQNVNSKVRSLDIATDQSLLIPVSDTCIVSGPYVPGECKISYVNKISDLGSSAIINKTTSFGSMRAFDLSISLAVKATADGGFIVVGTKKPYDLNINKNYSAPFGNGYNMTAFAQQFSQTDAFVAKCNASGNIEWTTIFDNKATGGGGNVFTNNGNPRNQTNLDNWMNFTTTRSKKDIKRQECLYAITTSIDGEIIIGGNMSSNIDDNYLAMVENTCDLNMSNHLIQSIFSWEDPGVPLVRITNMNNFVASNINTGRIPGNTNQVAEFIVNNAAVIKMEAGQEINMYDGTDLDAGTDVYAYINPSHTCTTGPIYSYNGFQNIGNKNEQLADKLGKGKEISKTLSKINKNITIFPNPTNAKVVIKHSKEIRELELLNIYGKLLIKISNHGSSESHFDLSNLPSGIYFVRVGNKIETSKIIKL